MAATGLSADVAAEIRTLRKGRGLQASELRLGPLLRELTDRPEAGDAATRRRALSAELNRCSAPLPEDLRTAVRASLALSAETAKMPYLHERVRWLADQLQRDYRTALRRIDAAELLLAEQVARELRRRRGRTASAPDGWYVDELRTVLRLGPQTVESTEHRRIVCTRDGLRQVMAWLDVPGNAGQPEPDLRAEMLYGGILLREENPSSNRFNIVVRLPAPVKAGQQHEYGVILRMSRHMLVRPHYILTPECQCNKFDLRVRFDPDRPPAWVRRVDGETVRTFENAQPTGDFVVPDATGEVHEEFRDLTMYLGYGIQWRPSEDDRAR